MTLRLACSMLALGLGLTGVLYAQPAPARFERIDSEAGLSHNTVLSILQDREGFLWVGTSDGLNRYDGYGFVTYRHNPFDTTSLSHNAVHVLLEDRAGTLWVGREDGLNRFDRQAGRFVRYHLVPDSLPLTARRIQSLLEDRAGRLWVGMHSTLYRFPSSTAHGVRAERAEGPGYAEGPDPEATGQATHAGPARVFPDVSSLSLYQDREGTLWANGDSLYSYDPLTDDFLSYKLPSAWSYSMLGEDEQGRLWFQAEKAGVGVFDPRTARTSTRALLPREDLITAILDDRKARHRRRPGTR